MIGIKKPIALKCLRYPIERNQAFEKKILANYDFMTADIRKEELLYLLMGTDREEEPSGMTTLVENISIENHRDVLIQYMNQIVNRIVNVQNDKLSFQDRVFISCFFRKLGIHNVSEFIKNVVNSVGALECREQLIHCYERYLAQDSRVIKEEIEQIIHSVGTFAKEEDRTEERVSVYPLSQRILNRLHYGEVSEFVYHFNRSYAEGGSYISHNEYLLAEEYNRAKNVQFMQMKNEIAGIPVETGEYAENPYEMIRQVSYDIRQNESGTIGMTQDRMVTDILEDALFHIIKMTEVNIAEGSHRHKNYWIETGYELCNMIENTLERFRIYHTGGAERAGNVLLPTVLHQHMREYELWLIQKLEHFWQIYRTADSNLSELLYQDIYAYQKEFIRLLQLQSLSNRYSADILNFHSEDEKSAVYETFTEKFAEEFYQNIQETVGKDREEAETILSQILKEIQEKYIRKQEHYREKPIEATGTERVFKQSEEIIDAYRENTETGLYETEKLLLKKDTKEAIREMMNVIINEMSRNNEFYYPGSDFKERFAEEITEELQQKIYEITRMKTETEELEKEKLKRKKAEKEKAGIEKIEDEKAEIEKTEKVLNLILGKIREKYIREQEHYREQSIKGTGIEYILRNREEISDGHYENTEKKADEHEKVFIKEDTKETVREMMTAVINEMSRHDEFYHDDSVFKERFAEEITEVLHQKIQNIIQKKSEEEKIQKEKFKRIERKVEKAEQEEIKTEIEKTELKETEKEETEKLFNQIFERMKEQPIRKQENYQEQSAAETDTEYLLKQSGEIPDVYRGELEKEENGPEKVLLRKDTKEITREMVEAILNEMGRHDESRYADSTSWEKYVNEFVENYFRQIQNTSGKRFETAQYQNIGYHIVGNKSENNHIYIDESERKNGIDVFREFLYHIYPTEYEIMSRKSDIVHEYELEKENNRNFQQADELEIVLHKVFENIDKKTVAYDYRSVVRNAEQPDIPQANIIYRQENREQVSEAGQGSNVKQIRNLMERNHHTETVRVENQIIHENTNTEYNHRVEQQRITMQHIVQENIQKEMRNITEQVYQRIEKKLQGERKRRGM